MTASTDAESVRRTQVAAEQVVVDRAYGELDRQLAAARASLTAIEAAGASGTHQARGERDAYAAHYASLISSLEGVEDRLVFGRMDMHDTDGAARPSTVASPAGRSGSGQADAGSPGAGEPEADSAGAPSADSTGNRPTQVSAEPILARHYVGRIGIQDARHREVVLDWRAPLSRAFYQATASRPMGLVRRRHIDTRARQVIGLEDEVLDVRALTGTAAELARGGVGSSTAQQEASLASETLQGEGALIAAMSAARDGRMGDIVATIQAEQDQIVTSDGTGVLVVQGGPGTGKTAVALHRVAYLFYAERTRLERSGVLLVGPSRTFLRYVEQVLPSLGETGVVSTTIADLVPGVRARGTEPAAVAELKGRGVWAEILRRAVRGLQRVPDEPRRIVVQGTALRLEPADVREAMSRARRSGKPHNQAREPFVLWLLERLTDQYAAATGQDASDEDTRAWIREDIRTARDARREINLCWMPTTPVGLLERLLARPALLAVYAPELTEAERESVYRTPGAELTVADVPLIDELAELLGPSEDAQARRARLEARRRAELVAYAAHAIESQDLGGGMVSAEMLADRVEQSGPSLTLAERARADRTWTYGHVVVDEAQELGDMAWRALARRCPVRSFTVVGDLAQYSGPHAPTSWGAALAELGTPVVVGVDDTVSPAAGRRRSSAPAGPSSRSGGGARMSVRSGRRTGRGAGRSRRAASTPLREEVLSVCYRTPATIMEAAERVVTAMGHPPVYPVRSVRDLPGCLEVTDLSRRTLASEAVNAAWDESPDMPGRASASELDAQWARELRTAVTQETTRLDAAVGDGGGRVAVISSQPDVAAAWLGEDPALAAQMEAPDGDVLRARVAVMGPVTSKGLEFDVVVLVDPATIALVSPGDLYVAMTRPTRRLRVVSRQALPAGLAG